MKTYSRATVIDFFYDKISKGDMQFSQLRVALEKYNIDKDEVNIVVRQVDKMLQRGAQMKSIRAKGRTMFFAGVTIAVIGICITAMTYINAFGIEGNFILAYGPILGGVTIAGIGAANMNRK